MDSPVLAALRHHVSGAIARGEAQPVVASTATWEVQRLSPSGWRVIARTPRAPTADYLDRLGLDDNIIDALLSSGEAGGYRIVLA